MFLSCEFLTASAMRLYARLLCDMKFYNTALD